MSTETEERAIKSVPELIKINGNYIECWRNGYIRGATEQEAITKREMIDKAIKYMGQIGFWGYLSAEEGFSEEVFKDQFRQTMNQ